MTSFETVLKKYLNTFFNQEMYFVGGIRNLELFKENPTNIDVDVIRMKISAINDRDLLANNLCDDMINHILNLNIDSRMQKGDLGVVQQIAQLNTRGESYSLLHFASVYCNFHRPDLFPIYSDQYHDFYKRYIKENNLPLDPEKITSYDVFSKALNDLVERLNLKGKLNYLHLRKFAWLYAELVVKESSLSK